MKALDARVGESNRSIAEKIPPPPAGKGEPRYVGIEDCENCHKKIVVEWKATVHARAWDELVKVDKQWSYDCISCHVTGYGRGGGSSMAHVDDLKDIQCEVCHGAGSEHSDEPKKKHLTNPTEALCKECHTPEHSDTFNYTAYLRDILGPNHGAKRLTALGTGPTGHDLRHGAMEKAKQL
jgi:Cytochrome c554 and c-prime